MNPHLDFLLSALYARDPLASEHLADLCKSGLSDATIERQRFRTVPPHMIDALLGFPAPSVQSAYVIPFANPLAGQWLNHVRLKIFPPLTTSAGTTKYLQPRCSGARLYFPISSLDVVCRGDEPLWTVEGEKKSLAVAQLGLPAVGFCGVEGWHLSGSRDLLADFDAIRLVGRTVEIAVDGDLRTNPNVSRGAHRLAEALRHRGARPRFVHWPVAA